MNMRDGESMARCSDFMQCFSLFLFLPCSDHTSHTPFYFFSLEHASNHCAVVCVGSVQTNLTPISNLGRLLSETSVLRFPRLLFFTSSNLHAVWDAGRVSSSA